MLCCKWSCWVILLWSKLQGWIQLRAWVAHQTFKYLPLQRNPGSWGRHLDSLSNSQEELGLDAIQNTTTWGDSWLACEAKRCLILTSEANRIHEQTLVMVLIFILQGSVSLNSLPVTSLMRRRDFYFFFLRSENHLSFLLKHDYWNINFTFPYTANSFYSPYYWNKTTMAE